MRHHALPDAAFRELGAGRPDPATIQELRRAQLGKHLLLLREVLKTTTPRWYGRLTAIQRTDPDAARRLLTDPLFGAWVAHHLRSPETLPDADPMATGGATRWLEAHHEGLSIRVRLEDTDPRRGLLGLPPTGRLGDDELAHWQDRLTDAWQILVSRHRPAAAVLASVLGCVVPVEADPAARGISATSADAFGAVAMSAPADGTSFAVGLLHEAQHSILNATRYLFELHTTPNALAYSPWRDDPRPDSGVLHGAYAYLAVTRFWRTEAAATRARLAAFEFARWREAVAVSAGRLLARGALTPAGNRFVSALCDEVRPWLDEPATPPPRQRTDAYECSERARTSTDAYGCSEQTFADRACRAGEIERLARLANADHHLRWRLRNLIVDPADAAALARAYQAGRRPAPVESRLVPAPRRALESSARLDLIHRTLRGEPEPVTGAQPGGRPTAGDAAFVRGDHATASRAYSRTVLNSPDDDAAWTGLALSAPLEGRLEVIVSAYRELGAKPGPVAFASWINS